MAVGIPVFTQEYVKYPHDIKLDNVLSCDGCRMRINTDTKFNYIIMTQRYMSYKIECSRCWRMRKERD